MSIWSAVGIFLCVWTVCSIWWFIINMGNKQGKDDLWDYMLSPPIIVIVHTMVFISTLFGWNK